MGKPLLLALSAAGIVATAFAARQVAIRVVAAKRASGVRGTVLPPAPGHSNPQASPPPPGVSLNGTVPSGVPLVGGKPYTASGDGVVVDGVHYSWAEAGLVTATGGTYGAIKQGLAHPVDTITELGGYIGL